MPASNRLDAVFFRSRGGNEPVRQWLKSLGKEQRKAIGEDIAYVNSNGRSASRVSITCGERFGKFGRRWTIESHERSSRLKESGWYCSTDSSRKRSARRIRTSSWR